MFDWKKLQGRRRPETITHMIRYVETREDDKSDLHDAIRYMEEVDYVDQEEVWIRAKTSAAQQFAQESGTTKMTQVPEAYRRWASVFDKKTSERIPRHEPWDHAINLKPDFELKVAKAYPLSHKEDELLEEWIEEQLAKG